MCGYIQRISQKCCSSVVCNICRGYTEAAMELNRKGWWYCGTSISVPPPRVQMLHLRCGRLQWWEQLLCCELTGKTERMQKCQERERVTETKTEGSVHHQRASFPALCWRDAWSCQESLQIRVRSESSYDRSGPWALKTEGGGKKDSQSEEQVRTDRLCRSRVNWKWGSSWRYFQASKRQFLFCIDFQMPFLLSCYPSSKQ